MQTVRMQNAGMFKRQDKNGRLKEARQKRYRTAKEASIALGVPYGTYSGHEAGSRGFSNEEASRYARFFQVRLDWLLFGNGNSDELKIRPLVGVFGRGGVVKAPSVDPVGEGNLSIIMDTSVSESAVSYLVPNYDMTPWFQKGNLIVCGYKQTDLYDVDEKLVVAKFKNSEPRLVIAHLNDISGGLEFECFGHPAIKGLEVEWIEEALAIIPYRHWHSLRVEAEALVEGARETITQFV